MGRHPNPPDINKHRMIAFRVTDDEYHQLTACMQQFGISRSQFIREALQGYALFLEQTHAD